MSVQNYPESVINKRKKKERTINSIDINGIDYEISVSPELVIPEVDPGDALVNSCLGLLETWRKPPRTIAQIVSEHGNERAGFMVPDHHIGLSFDWNDALEYGSTSCTPDEETGSPTLPQFKREVMKEIKTLKSNLKPKHIKRLNFETFEPWNGNQCLFAQLSGSDYKSDEAVKLLPKKYKSILKPGISLYTWFNTRCKKTSPFKDQSFTPGNRLTAIEKFFFFSTEKQNKRIYKYLSGENKTIKL